MPKEERLATSSRIVVVINDAARRGELLLSAFQFSNIFPSGLPVINLFEKLAGY
jgi:hypothetical protein